MKIRTAMLCMTLASLGYAGAVPADTVLPPPPVPKSEPKLEPRLEPIPEPVESASGAVAEEHEVSVIRRGGDRIEEFRFKGRLYMIRVTPAVGPAYTMVDDRGDGIFNRKDMRGTPLKPAQWNVLSW